MKLIELIRDLFRIASVIRRYGRQHHATLAMVNGIYIRQPGRNDLVVTGTESILSIKPVGNFYQVTRTDYVSNTPEHEETWLATYGWHSNGHLIEIGSDRYCIFDAGSKTMYLETLTEQGKTTIEVFIKNLQV